MSDVTDLYDVVDGAVVLRVHAHPAPGARPSSAATATP